MQKQCIRLRVHFLGLRRLPEQRDLELLDHRRGDLVLHREDVVELPVPGVRPQVRVRARLDQLRGDAHLVAGPAHRAFEDVRNIEPLGDLRDLHVLALVRERRGARDHAQLRDLRQQVQQLLGDPVGEILLVLVRAHVDEREHRDRLVAVGFHQRLGAPFGTRRLGRRLFALRGQDELVDGEVAEGEREHAHDHAIELLAGLWGDRLAAIDLALALQAFGRDLERPSENQHRQQANDQYYDDQADRGGTKTERGEHSLGDLDQQPRDREVRGADAQHIAPPELADEGGRYCLSPCGRIISEAAGNWRIPAAYESHWTTLRRRSLVQVLSAARSVGVSVNRRPPWRRSVAAYPRLRAGNTSTVTWSLDPFAVHEHQGPEHAGAQHHREARAEGEEPRLHRPAA